MSKIRRSFTPEDRYSIIQKAIRDGHAETCRKYHLSPSSLRKWRLKYLSKGRPDWVQGERRNYYLLSVINVYTRKILAWLFQGSIRQLDLINLLRSEPEL